MLLASLKACGVGLNLTVASVSGAAITFSTDITTGDASAATNCVLSRAEVYPLPACEVGDPPAVIYTRDIALEREESVLYVSRRVDMAWSADAPARSWVAVVSMLLICCLVCS